MQINRELIGRQVRDKIKSQTFDGNLSICGNTLIPVMEAGLEPNIVFHSTTNTSGTITMQPDITKQYWLWACELSFVKDAACDLASGTLNVAFYIDGPVTSQRNACAIAVLTTTAQYANKVVVLPRPVKIKQGTAITCTGSFTAGALVRVMNCWLTEVEP